jgi:hypothetical protein
MTPRHRLFLLAEPVVQGIATSNFTHNEQLPPTPRSKHDFEDSTDHGTAKTPASDRFYASRQHDVTTSNHGHEKKNHMILSKNRSKIPFLHRQRKPKRTSSAVADIISLISME